MDSRTLVTAGSQSSVEEALARLAEAMRRKPPKPNARKPAKKRRWNLREPTSNEIEATRRLVGESEHR